MRLIPWTLLLLELFGCSAGTSGLPNSRSLPPHLDLETTGEQYSRLFELNPSILEDPDATLLKPVLDLGRRNLDWLRFINGHRDEAHQISLTSKDAENAYPVDAPREYNAATALKTYQDLIPRVPGPMRDVLLGSEALPVDPTIVDADYVKFGREVDSLYQIASRWLNFKQYLDQFAARRGDDVRGYVFLSREPDLRNELARWSELPPETRERLRSWLISSCGNSHDVDSCGQELNDLTASHGSILGFLDRYLPTSQARYDRYFKMGWSRGDISWSADPPETLHIPFIDPNDDRLKSYLKDNIEEEWRWQNWNLRMDFQGWGPFTAHLRLEAGATPHVVVAANAIVMDGNQPFTEYDSRWIIRHEFGHILGFVDCYVEYYDVDRQIMVSYQLDTSNLMCSRRGTFKQAHFDELKRVYFGH